MEWTDPDEGTVWEMYYDVPQGGNNRECVMYRVKGTNTWLELPPFATPPDEAMNAWFGEVRDNKPDYDGIWMDIGKKHSGDERAWAFVNFLLNGMPY